LGDSYQDRQLVMDGELELARLELAQLYSGAE
jgi:hypothetical protein